MKVGDLFVALGVQADTPKVKDFQQALMGSTLKAAALVTSLVGVSLALRDMIQESMGAAVGFQKFQSMTGLSATELQKWQIMAERSNVSAEAAAGSVKALQAGLAEISIGRGNIAPYQMLGIDPRGKNAFQVLEEVQDKIRGMSRPMAVNLMQQMGINPEMIVLLEKTRAQMKALQGPEGWILGKEGQAKLLLAKRALVDLKLELTAFSRTIITDLSPIIKNVGSFIETTVGHIRNMILALHEFPGVLKVIGAAIGVAMAVMHPWIAALSAVLLLLEDIYVYQKGGKSLIGSIVGEGKGQPEQHTSFKESLAGKAWSWLTEVGPPKKSAGVVQNNTAHIQVDGSKDPSATAKAVKEAFDIFVDTTLAQVNN